ncbi:MAG: hypothetical protein DRN78_05705 [Thermoproteota archaeon]|nr:MAG: hypothetical protein DRN78_05705 [Candidatus Korarchaeota archaeon]
MQKILKKAKEISGGLFDGRIEQDEGFFILDLWIVSNRWVTDAELERRKEATEEFLREIKGIPPIEVKESGNIEELAKLGLGEPTLVVDRDPDGEYGVEIYVNNYITVLSYVCDIASGVGEWRLEKYKLTHAWEED